MRSLGGLRRAFSLLEVMIATAILAASAMVLLSLISLGTRFGSKAETRISALVQAVSIMDESVLAVYSGTAQDSFSSVLAGPEPRAYRVVIEPVTMVEEGSLSSSFDPSGENASLGAQGNFSNPFGTSQLGPGNATSPLTPSAPPPPPPSELISITVELYDAADAASLGATDSKPLVQLQRLLRRQPASDSSAGESNAGNSGLSSSSLSRGQ